MSFNQYSVATPLPFHWREDEIVKSYLKSWSEEFSGLWVGAWANKKKQETKTKK